MDFTQLKYFQVIARTGNISKAAQELFVTQPNLSKSIARLENELGVPLFEHRRGKIVLNEYGRIFLNSVTLSFSELTKGIQAIQRLYDTSQNVLSLGCSIDDFLPDVLKEFSLIHPEIGIRQFSCEPDELARRLHRNAVDIAVVPYPIQDKLLVYQELGRKDFVIMTWEGHPLSGRRSVSISELVEERFVCDRSRMDTDMLRTICNARGFEPIIAFEMESTDLIYRLVEGKAGIAFMPMAQLTKMHRESPERNGLKLLYIDDDLPPAQLGLLFHKDYVFSAAAICLRDFLINWLKREDELLSQLGYINRTI